MKQVLEENSAAAYYLVETENFNGFIREEEDEDRPGLVDHLFALAAAALPSRQATLTERFSDGDLHYMVVTVESELAIPEYVYLLARKGKLYLFAVFEASGGGGSAPTP